MAYPVSYEVERPERYNRLTVAFRLILAIPQLFLVGGLGLVAAGGSNSYRDDAALQSVLSIINTGVLTLVAGILVFVAWFAILFTGRFPEGLYGFSVGVSRWYARLYAYLYLLVDEYPPFSLASDPDAARAQPRLA
jgi:hypothetical protein